MDPETAGFIRVYLSLDSDQQARAKELINEYDEGGPYVRGRTREAALRNVQKMDLGPGGGRSCPYCGR
jgi:hypothetical protein